MKTKDGINVPDGVMVYDNGGRSFDRYTIIINKDIYGMSHNPNHPQGFNQYCGDIFDVHGSFSNFLEGLGDRIYAIPNPVLKAIKQIMEKE